MFEQERMIMRLQQRVLNDPHIQVCFLSGSYGRRTDDAYSDLDVALVYADASARAAAWQDRRDFVQAVMPYVAVKSFDAAHIRPFFHIALYSNGSKVDYRYEAQTDLQPNPWDRDIRILKDSGEWGAAFQTASAQALRPQPHLTATELQHLDNRFWVMYWDVLRLLLRGDSQKPFTIYLELLHFTLPPLLGVLPANHPAQQTLRQANFSADTRRTARHLRDLLDAYLEARTAVIQQLHLDFQPDTTFENNIQRLIKKQVK